MTDTIHGAQGIGANHAGTEHTIDVADICRGTTPEAMQTALTRSYDRITAPVHRDPDPRVSRVIVSRPHAS